MSKMHFRDVTLMGLCFGRQALAGVGNFWVYQAKTWRQRSGNWLHLCKTVSVLSFGVFCLSVMSVMSFLFCLFFKYSMTLSPLHIKPCWKDFSGYRLDRLVSSLPSLSWWLAVHNDNKINSIQAWNQKEKKEVMYPSCYTGIKGNFCMLYDVFLWLCRDKFFFDDLDFSSKFNQIFTPFY